MKQICKLHNNNVFGSKLYPSDISIQPKIHCFWRNFTRYIRKKYNYFCDLWYCCYYQFYSKTTNNRVRMNSRINKLFMTFESAYSCSGYHNIKVFIYDYSINSWSDIIVNSKFFISNTIPRCIIIGINTINNLYISFKYNISSTVFTKLDLRSAYNQIPRIPQ